MTMTLPEPTSAGDTSPYGESQPASDNLPAVRSESQMVGYTTRLLVQALFPYRKPTSDKIVSRDGNTRITIISSDGLPYGKYPRLIMAYLITEAVKRRDLPEDEARKIPLGNSMNEFLKNMGLKSRGTGGARGTIGLLREQLRRLTGTTIRAEKLHRSIDGDRESGGNVSVADSWDLWFDSSPDQQTLEPSYLELTRQFYQEISSSSIPLDLNILRNLTGSRSMDIYIWLTLRRFSMRRPTEVDWGKLQLQFGPGTPDTGRGRTDFRRRFREAMEDVLELWPDAGVSFTDAGILIQPGQPSVPRKPPRRELGR